MLDIKDDFPLNQQIVVERQRILREIDESLDGIFDRNKTGVDQPGFHRVKNFWHVPKRHKLARREIGLGQQCLFGESAKRTEKSDARGCVGHKEQGYARNTPTAW